MKLNKAQTEAVLHNTGPMLVLAGPGSGKTMVITERIKTLLDHYGASPHKILVVTFTRAAAEEMKERFQRKMEGSYAPVKFGTFHAIFFTILKQAYHYNAQSILKDYQKKQILREIMENLHMETEDETEFLSRIETEISQAKAGRIAPADFSPACCSREAFVRFYQNYEASLSRQRLLDFDDMLTHCYELLIARKDILALWQQQFDYILVDEFQDSATRFRLK